VTDRTITKLWVAVRLAQPHHDPRDGWFQLFPEVDNLGRPETVLELLNSPRRVIPFLKREEKSVVLLVRENIDWVAVGPGEQTRLVVPPERTDAHVQRVELGFLDERRVAATVRWGDFPLRERLSDFLNQSDLFVAAEAAFGTLIVNKSRLREVRILDAPDDPSGAVR
jgi:hypothetical protein